MQMLARNMSLVFVITMIISVMHYHPLIKTSINPVDVSFIVFWTLVGEYSLSVPIRPPFVIFSHFFALYMPSEMLSTK